MRLTLIQKGGAAELPLAALRLTTSLNGAGILEWETPYRGLMPEEGDAVRLEEDAGIFYGYVFRVEDDGRRLRVLCYDQIKYLLYKDTRQFTNRTADSILTEFVRERELKAGTIAATGVTLPSLLYENQTLLSMVQDALEETFRVSGQRFWLTDQCGSLTLEKAENLQSGVLLSGENQLTGWTRSSDIDGATYTRFLLLQEDRRSGFRRVTTAENAEQRKYWGILQYFERVDHSWNEAQVQARLAALKESYSDKRRSFTAEGLGDFRCLAGRGALCQIGDGAAESCLIEESEIEGEGGVYRMRLKLRVL